MANDYSNLGLTAGLRKIGSLGDRTKLWEKRGGVLKEGYVDKDGHNIKLQGAAIGPYEMSVSRIYKISNVGTISPVVLGATGSGTETLIITSSLTNTYPSEKILFAIHELSFYVGTAPNQNGAIFDPDGTVSFTAFDQSSWLDWGDSNNLGLKGRTYLRNNGTTTTEVTFRNQWRYLIPQGGAAQ